MACLHTQSAAGEGQNAFKVLGVRVDGVQIPDVITRMEFWIAERGRGHYVAVTGMHGVMEAQYDAPFKQVLGEADLVVPDGMPLVWLGRISGLGLRRRVYGPELMENFFATTAARRYTHFLYGGADGVADNLAQELGKRFPWSQIVGTYTPPFRPLTESEESNLARKVQVACPDVLWVGLSTPKQEKWMHAHRHSLPVPVMVGVGAAFDFHTGRVKQAPAWMRENGFEWLFRLLTEPRRLWRRYLILGSKFTWNVCLEMSRLRKFN
jgi:N-acetylglucosaminyldiphosphoundecaprenol N-acetyl-beta-D-mannosaminyltransferase